jgi:hypothetical protein
MEDERELDGPCVPLTERDVVARARESLARATAGPWAVYCPRGNRYHVKTLKGGYILEHLDPHDIRRGADAELIAAAPILLAQLCEEVERLRREVDWLRGTTGAANAGDHFHDPNGPCSVCGDKS